MAGWRIRNFCFFRICRSNSGPNVFHVDNALDKLKRKSKKEKNPFNGCPSHYERNDIDPEFSYQQKKRKEKFDAFHCELSPNSRNV
jgi:hypothetical protein